MNRRPPELFDLATDLRITIGRIGRRFAQLYAEGATASGLAFTEASVLSRLAREGPSSPSSLAGMEQVTPQAVGSVVSALEAQGLVTRTPDPTDGRKVIVALTDAGTSEFGKRARSLTQHLEDVLERELTRKERDEIAAVVPLLERIAGQL